MAFSNIQEWVAIAAIASPSVVGIIGIVMNRNAVNKVEKRLEFELGRMEKGMDTLDADVKSSRVELLSEIRGIRDRIDNVLSIIIGHGQDIAMLKGRNPPC